MRAAFIESFTEVAGRDPRLTLITGDLGFGVVLDFARSHRNQFLNAGIAEQNMAGVAAGMAMAGRIVFIYSIANFPTIRCLEQIRNDICYHRANVTIVSIGGGFAYGALGMSHHATEDLAILRALPGMTVIAPGDPVETAAAVRAAAAGIGPVYLRLGRAGEPLVHAGPIDWRLGKAFTVRDGGALTLISTGGMLATTVAAAAELSKAGIRARVLSMHTLHPLDADAILRAARETRLVVTVEEHSIVGGLGGAVAEVLAEAGIPNVRFRRFGLPRAFNTDVGDQDYLRKLYGLDCQSIAARVLELLRKDD